MKGKTPSVLSNLPSPPTQPLIISHGVCEFHLSTHASEAAKAALAPGTGKYSLLWGAAPSPGRAPCKGIRMRLEEGAGSAWSRVGLETVCLLVLLCSERLSSSPWETASTCSPFSSVTFEGGFDFSGKAKSKVKLCVENQRDVQFAECDLLLFWGSLFPFII